MSRRTTGWVLLALAVGAAVAVALIARRAGGLDGWLGLTSVVAVAAGVTVVVVDARHARRRRTEERRPDQVRARS